MLLGNIVSGFVASLGIIACGIGLAFTSAYAYAINGHLWGQAYNVSSGTGAVAAVPVEAAPEPDLDLASDF